jgi:hypothetical protein
MEYFAAPGEFSYEGARQRLSSTRLRDEVEANTWHGCCAHAYAEGTAMLAWLVLHSPFLLFPVAPLPICQLEVLPPAVIEEHALIDFSRRVDGYVRVHRRLERSLPPEHIFADLEDMSAAVDALHDAIVGAQPNARPGTIFTPAIADLLARRLDRAITAKGYTAAEILAAINVGSLPGMPKPEINGRFPAQWDMQVWPALAAVLPPLPPELQYRFADRDLVIVDTHADLVVDILKDALPPAPARIRRWDVS